MTCYIHYAKGLVKTMHDEKDNVQMRLERLTKYMSILKKLLQLISDLCFGKCITY